MSSTVDVLVLASILGLGLWMKEVADMLVDDIVFDFGIYEGTTEV